MTPPYHPNRIAVIRNPKLPQYRFEWHPDTKKVYVIDLSKTVTKNGEKKHEATPLAEHCDDYGRAFGFVQTWCRGFQEGVKSVQTAIV